MHVWGADGDVVADALRSILVRPGAVRHIKFAIDVFHGINHPSAAGDARLWACMRVHECVCARAVSNAQHVGRAGRGARGRSLCRFEISAAFVAPEHCHAMLACVRRNGKAAGWREARRRGRMVPAPNAAGLRECSDTQDCVAPNIMLSLHCPTLSVACVSLLQFDKSERLEFQTFRSLWSI